jgi:hypothetical protein
MWPRVCEALLGAWLLASPWFLGHSSNWAMRTADVSAGSLIVLFALASFSNALRRAHLVTVLVAALLIVFSYVAAPMPGSAGVQNDILVGLVLMMIAIVPGEANRPPLAWRRYPSDDSESIRPRTTSGV